MEQQGPRVPASILRYSDGLRENRVSQVGQVRNMRLRFALKLPFADVRLINFPIDLPLHLLFPEKFWNDFSIFLDWGVL